MFRFLHAADLHLDSPLRGLDRYEGAPVELFRRAGRAAMENLVALALSERVQFVVLAGDLFDGDWPDVNTGLFFVRQAARLNDAGIPVYLIRGNHDAANRMTRSLMYPENVHVFPSDRPITLQFEGGPVALHGQSYATQDMKQNLAASYPPPLAGCFNIGLLHTALTGREGHADYAPCTVEELISRGYDYWALGHAHQRESVSAHPRTLIEFPGNIQGRNIRETGAKGCLIVHVDANRRANAEFHALDVCRWARVPVDLSDVETDSQLREQVQQALEAALDAAEGRPVAARVVLEGQIPWRDRLLARRENYRDDIRAAAIEIGMERIWIEQVEIRATAVATAARGEADDTPPAEDARSEILRVVRELREHLSDALASLLGQSDLNSLLNKLPPELRRGEDALDFSSPDLSAELLDQATALLVERFEAAEDEP